MSEIGNEFRQLFYGRRHMSTPICNRRSDPPITTSRVCQPVYVGSCQGTGLPYPVGFDIIGMSVVDGRKGFGMDVIVRDGNGNTLYRSNAVDVSTDAFDSLTGSRASDAAVTVTADYVVVTVDLQDPPVCECGRIHRGTDA